jgi:hypothetical protein
MFSMLGTVGRSRRLATYPPERLTAFKTVRYS